MLAATTAGRRLRKLLLLRPWPLARGAGDGRAGARDRCLAVPPYFAGRAIDDGIRGGDEGALTVILVLFVAAAVNWVATYADLARELGRSAGAPGPVRRCSSTSSGCRSVSTSATRPAS